MSDNTTRSQWKIVLFVLIPFSVSTSAYAESFQTIEGDANIPGSELKRMVVGKTLEYAGGSKSVFNENGTYEFHVGGKVFVYDYNILDEGIVCITSKEYGSRCDLIVKNGEDLFSINDKNQRYKAELKN